MHVVVNRVATPYIFTHLHRWGADFNLNSIIPRFLNSVIQINYMLGIISYSYIFDFSMPKSIVC